MLTSKTMTKTILLTSAGMKVKDEIIRLLSKPPSETQLAHITTASNPKENPEYMFRDKKLMLDAGFQVEDIDIEGKSEEELRQILKNKDIVYVQGGEGYYLLKAVKESGFDKVIKDLIDVGVIYVGVSAGSYILCPTLEMHTWKSKDTKRDTYGFSEDVQALGLVPFLVTVHYENKYKEDITRGINSSKYPVNVLTDDQAILVKNGKAELVGKGEAVIL